MHRLHFPKIHTEPGHIIQNVNEIIEEQISPGQQAADRVARIVGSWRFIIVQSVLLLIWVILNTVAWIAHWDPYPFILMNLVLSTQAAFTAPILMMSQNRQAEKDRIENHNDYLVNMKAEEEIRAILSHLEAQNQALAQIHQLLTATDGQ